jgi:beta-lactamase regulating signal transducer with metallopeptidase domain
MSLSGSIIALFLFLMKPLLRDKLPKYSQYYLWLVVIAALLLPVSKMVTLPEQPVYNVVQLGVTAVTDAALRDYISYVQANPAPLIQDKVTVAHISLLSFSAFLFTVYVYPLGAAIYLLITLAKYFRFAAKLKRRNIATDIECTLKVYRNQLASTPMLIGFFKPVIILPDKKYTDAQLQSVLLHELTHYRRHDVCVKWLTLLACAVHWFNPIVWLVRREIDRAAELSCDEAVIRRLDNNGIQDYGETLIYVAADSFAPNVVFSMCEEKRQLKERLGAIMKNKQHTRFAVIISVLLISALALTACALGAGRAAMPPRIPQSPEETVTADILNEGGELVYLQTVKGFSDTEKAGITLPTGDNIMYIYAGYTQNGEASGYDYVLEQDGETWEIAEKYPAKYPVTYIPPQPSPPPELMLPGYEAYRVAFIDRDPRALFAKGELARFQYGPLGSTETFYGLGLIDINLNVIVEPIYLWISELIGGAYVINDRYENEETGSSYTLYGLMDKNGKIITAPLWVNLSEWDLEKGTAHVRRFLENGSGGQILGILNLKTGEVDEFPLDKVAAELNIPAEELSPCPQSLSFDPRLIIFVTHYDPDSGEILDTYYYDWDGTRIKT